MRVKINKVRLKLSSANRVKAKYKYKFVLFFVSLCEAENMAYLFINATNHMHSIQFYTQYFILFEYRHSALFDVKYQCSATTQSRNLACM